MSITLLNKNQAGTGIWTQDSLKAGKNTEIVQKTNPYVIDEHTLACWHFNPNDEVPLADVVSASTLSNVSVTTAAGYYKFDSGAAYYSGDAANFYLSKNYTGLDDFTVDFWVKAVSNSWWRLALIDSKNNYWQGKWIGIGTGGSSSSDGHIELVYCYGNVAYGNTVNTSMLVSTFQQEDWRHVAISITKEHHALMFVDGECILDSDISATWQGNFSINYLALYANTATICLDELRISNVVRWTEDFDVPTEPYADSSTSDWYVINNTGADAALRNLTSGLSNTICTAAATTTSSASSATPAVVVENYINGTSWYRVWSDGWCEQGGQVNQAQVEWTTITLLKPYANTNYRLLISQQVEDTEELNDKICGGYVYSNSQIKITCWNTAGQINWRTSGQINVS